LGPEVPETNLKYNSVGNNNFTLLKAIFSLAMLIVLKVL
jgi:hypothetical protein